MQINTDWLFNEDIEDYLFVTQFQPETTKDLMLYE